MKTILGLLFTVLMLASAAARADFYVGAGAYDTSMNKEDFKDRNVAPAVFLGWRPIELIGVEAGYYDFGKFQDEGQAVDAHALTLAALLSLEIGPVGVYAKGGLARSDLKFSGFRDKLDNGSNNDPFGGVGVTFDILDKLYVYGEALHFATDNPINVYGIGVRYAFSVL